MYVPDCRTDEHYNEKRLCNDDKTFINGFDMCVDVAIKNYFSNIDIYEDDFNKIGITFGDVDLSSLSIDMPLESLDNNKVLKMLYVIMQTMCHYTEMQRNEIVTSMLDGMPEEQET